MVDRKNSPPSLSWALQKLPEMDDHQFRQWQQLLEDRTGIDLPKSRMIFLQTNLGIRMREVGCSTYQKYFEKVISPPYGIMEWTILVDRLTVQETRFFRDEDACNLVADYVLTRPIEDLKKSSLEVWSVGCATGEEPYTLAIILSECMDILGLKHYFGVTGTDISKPALVKARLGRYNVRKLVTVKPAIKEKYFTEAKANQTEVNLVIKERVCFSQVNILDLESSPMFGINIIFCQNVLIYFKKWRRKEILNRLIERLVPGGILVLGQGEIAGWEHPHAERVPSDKTLAFIRCSEKTM